MNDSSVGAAWNCEPMIDDADIVNPAPLSNEPPLQFAALYAQSQPVNGKVSLSELGSISNRTDIPNEKIAVILEYSTDTETHLVSEPQFYWALHQAACVQDDESHIISNPAEGDVPQFGKELESRETSENNDSDSKDEIPDYNPTAEPLIRVTVSAKDAGSYIFKHAVYCLEGEFDSKPIKVLRRFRDFASLSGALVRKYPFRVIPRLPPKKITVSGRYFVGEDRDTFLARRAAGLSRFLNLLIQHPIIGKDAVVMAFLFESTFVVSKPPSDESDGQTADPVFISRWKPETAKMWVSMQVAMDESLQQVTSMCVLCEKKIARMETEESDARIWAHNYTSSARSSSESYPTSQDDLSAIEQRLEHGTQFAHATSENLATSRNSLSHGPLEQLKLYREMSFSVLDLFERVKVLGGNSIPDLKKKIATTQRKLAAASTKEMPKEEDSHRSRMVIQTAQDTIRQQTNRDWLIKSTVTRELMMVQTMQYQLSRVLRAFADTSSDDSSRVSEVVNYFTDAAESSPLKP